MTQALALNNICYQYPRSERAALDQVSFDVKPGERFALLGPNGCGKTTLFRLFATLLPMQKGSASIFGQDVVKQPGAVRSLIGVIFQNPSLDTELTGRENMIHHGHLYGLKGSTLKQRINANLERFDILDIADRRTGQLSGGQQRRIELAKALLPQPKLLLMDEPSTGLDPAARHALWQQVDTLRREIGLTVAMTTHLMDEADTCDRVAILSEGKRIALDTPRQLKGELGGDVVVIETPMVDTPAPIEAMTTMIREQLAGNPQVADHIIRFESTEGPKAIAAITDQFSDHVQRISVGPPTLDDVFLYMTGQSLSANESVN